MDTLPGSPSTGYRGGDTKKDHRSVLLWLILILRARRVVVQL